MNCADEQQTKEHDGQNLLNSIDIGVKNMKIENIQNFKNLINKYHEVWSNKKKRSKINLKHNINLQNNFNVGRCPIYRRNEQENLIIEREI